MSKAYNKKYHLANREKLNAYNRLRYMMNTMTFGEPLIKTEKLERAKQVMEIFQNENDIHLFDDVCVYL